MSFKKSKVTSISLILMLTMVAAMVLLPTVSAQDRKVYTYISARPDPVGVGQEMLITMWTDVLPPVDSVFSVVVPWEFTVTITKPDHTTETWPAFQADPVGSAWTLYYPTAVGDYSLEMSFGGAEYNNVTYLPATANPITFTVQEDAIQQWPGAPLPTNEYWERPIYGENREWSQISSFWPGVTQIYGVGWNFTGAFSPYTSAPDSGHILWTKPLDFGGILGGEHGSNSFYSGQSYESKWRGSVIIGGRLFYNKHLGSSASMGAVCVDLYTGETIWENPDISISFGQVLDFDSQNQHGGIAYLWQTGGTYKMIDPWTGEVLIEIPGGRNGVAGFDEKGNVLVYILSGTSLTLWNSTKCVLGPQPDTGFNNKDYWRPNANNAYNWSDGIEMAVTVPDPGTRLSISYVTDGKILAAGHPDPETILLVCYDALTGAQLWTQTMISQENAQWFFTPIADDTFAWFNQAETTWSFYNANTGALKSVSDPYESAWGVYSSSISGLGAISPVVAYGNLYSVGYDGRIHCYDMETGTLNWVYYVGSSGFETPYGTWPLAGGVFIVADGKVYVTTGEHSPSMPFWRGGKMHCVDAFDGTSVWNMSGWYETPIVADGYVVALNAYDNQLYCIGKGPSETTVDAQPKVSPLGDMVLIEGTVTDLSPGANGAAAMSDTDQSAWMGYVYMQKPIPSNAQGVPVSIIAIDPNGNYQDIGVATSDLAGNYGIEWTPPVPGTYQIIATFEGSASYGTSFDTTYFTVGEAPSPATPIEPEPTTPEPTEPEPTTPEPTEPEPTTPEPTEPEPTTPEPTAEAPLITTEIAILAAIAVAAIIGAASFWLLRKRK